MNGQGGGEPAFLYLAGYVILLVAGGGLFSLDTVVFARTGQGQDLTADADGTQLKPVVSQSAGKKPDFNTGT